MDFSFSDEQEAVGELADRIFTDLSTQERLRQLEAEADGDRFDRKLWGELAEAGLLGIALPEDVGRSRSRIRRDRAAGRGRRQHRGLRARHRDAGRRRRRPWPSSAPRPNASAGCPAWWPATPC